MFHRNHTFTKHIFSLAVGLALAIGLAHAFGQTARAAEQSFVSVLGVTPEGEACLMGGSLRNVIAEPDVLVDFMKHKQSYALVHLGDTRGEVVAIGAPETPEQGGDCEESFIQELTLSPEQLGLLQIAVKGSIGDTKKRLPKSVKELSRLSKPHIKLVMDYLVKAGLKDPKVHLRQVIETDIDGDGKTETLINALNTSNGDTLKGEYSLVLLVRGGLNEPQIVEIHKEISMEDEAEPSLIVAQTIVSLIDLEDDGKLELVLYGAFAFGEGWQVLRVRKDNSEQILFCGCG